MQTTCKLLEKIFHFLSEWKEQQKKEHKENMIAQAALDASLASLTTAVQNAAFALAAINPVASTPDSMVSAYMSGVDAQTVALASATPPPISPTPVPTKK